MNGTLQFLVISVLLLVITGRHLTNGVEEKPYKVVCYWSSWSAYRNGDGKFDVDNIDPFMCTHIIYAFAGLSRGNTISSYDPNLDLEDNRGIGMYKKFTSLKKKNKNLTLLLSIGGWKEGSIKYSVMARNSNTRSTFVQSCVSFLKKYNFDGLDVAWLYPATLGGIQEDKRNFALLLKELKLAFLPQGLILSAAISANKNTMDLAYDVPEINKYLDFFNVMTYDYHGDWDSKTGHGAPLFSRPTEDSNEKSLNVDSTLQYLISKGAARSKLILGLAFYGRTFTLKSQNVNSIGAPIEGKGKAGEITQEPGILGFSEICMHLSKETDWNVVFERHHQVPFTYKGRQWIAYDDIQSISLKMDYIKEKKLGGAMIWSMDTDDFRGNCYGFPYPLLSVVEEDLNGPIQEPITDEDLSTTVTPPTKATTSNPAIRTTTVKEEIVLKCTREGYFRHPKDCRKFYYCQPYSAGFSVVLYNCGPGTVFDERIAACGFIGSVPECNV